VVRAYPQLAEQVPLDAVETYGDGPACSVEAATVRPRFRLVPLPAPKPVVVVHLPNSLY